ncbi:MAG: DEAD/DEAH box helicase [Melioribacteraceae bacterium]|nr:DEAD/DEAH box helicase [Melioribacteraceae bacterium]
MNIFEEIGVEEQVLAAIKDLGFEKPTPVQEKVIPILVGEKPGDVIALAQTGTGKTAAFGLPLIQKTDIANKKIQHLILSPTRELCLQIADDLKDYSKYVKGFTVGAIFGGSSIDLQMKMLKRGVHIISATPGRLVDLINRKKVDLSQVETVVLDEADEMLNMGFKDELEAVLSQTPKNRTTLLFSATMAREVKSIASKYMKDPTEIIIGKKNVSTENVTHLCYMVHARDRYLALKRIVDFHPDVYGIIFCRTRKETQEVSDNLMNDGYNADALHGDLSQAQRDVVMNKFRSKHLSLLVATDVAARGLDVNDLTHVINYNLPDEIDAYTHRSGRTGRAGKKGTSIIIANMKEKQKISTIERQISKKFIHSSVPLGRDICKNQLFHLIDRMEKVEVSDTDINSFLPEINKKLEWLDRDELIKKFVSLEFNRFLDYYKRMPDLTAPAERSKSKKASGSNKDMGMSRFFINIGRKDGVKPTTIIGMINDYTGIRDIEIGEIDILDSFSFFETDESCAEDILEAFKDKTHKKRKIALELAQQAKRSSSRSSSDRNSDSRKRSFGDRGKRPFGDKGKRSFGDKDKRSSGDRDKRSFGDKDKKRTFKKR